MYHKKDRCVCCDSSNLELLLDLNNQPLANSYHSNTKPLPEYPLGVNLCKDCYHIQLTHIVNPDLLFKDYLYVSGTTQTMRDHFEWFSKFVIEYSNPKSVLDIACNDGSQLDCFKEKGINVDAEKFFDYYESQGWKKANGRPVVNWKRCISTWKTDEKQKKKK
mgnify:CR=1 FL=1